MVDSDIQVHQPTAILPFDPNAVTRAVLDPEDGDGERFVIMGDQFMPYSAYRSSFHTAWEQSLSGFGIAEQVKSQAYSISAAAFAATQYRCLTISQVPGLVVDQMTSDPVEWHPLIGFMPYMKKLMWHIEVSLLVWGVCYLRKVYNKYHFPSSLTWLHPEDITPQEDQYREVYEYYDTLTGDRIKRSEMVEIRTFDPDRSLDGKSAYEVAMSRITTERNLVMHAGSFFFNSARPDGILVSKTRLDKEGREKAKKDWEKFKGSHNAWQTYVSGGDWDWLPITIPPVDLAMVELKEDTRKDITAIFRTNGALIGLASVSDPLSAGSTLATIKRNHVESVTLPEYNDIAGAMNEQWLWVDFQEKNFYTLIADEANMPILSDVTSEISTVAVNLTNPLSPVVDYNEARKLMKMPDRNGYINKPPDQSIALLNNTLISGNEGRGFLGLEPLEVDILKTPDGKLIRRTDLGKYLDATMELIVNPPQAPPMGGFGMPGSPMLPPFGGGGMTIPPFGGGGQTPTAPTPINPYDQFRLPLASNTRSGSGCAITLCFHNDEIVKSIQTIVRTQIPVSDTQVWCDPGDFHLTIYQCDVLSMTQEVELYPVLAVTKPMPLVVKRVSKFDQDKYTVLILEVEATDDLKALQEKIYEKAQKIGVVSSSDYSDPTAWKPHITLAYLDPGTTIEETIFNAQVQPQAISLTRSEYAQHYTKEITPEPPEERTTKVRANGRTSLELSVDFAGNNLLRTAQRVLSRWASTEGKLDVEWYAVDSLRMPMLELENVSSYDTSRAMLAAFHEVPRTDTYTGAYAIRDGEIGVLLIPSDEIYNLRNASVAQLDEINPEEGMAEEWSPFVPLGIVRGETALGDRDLFESEGYPLVLSVVCLTSGQLKRGRWELRSRPHFDKELTSWQRVVTRKGRTHDFVPDFTTGIVADYVRSALTETDLPIEDIFARAKDISINGLSYQDPDVDPTPEEYEEYWRNYETSAVDLGQEWLAYMRRTLPDVLAWMETESTPAGIQEVLNRHHDQLAIDWVGTEENPGSLYSLALAGMAAGNDALAKETSMNPTTKRAKPDIGIEITWDLLSKQAQDFARSYSYKLIKGIDDTTARTVQDIFAEWTKSGKPFKDLAKALDPVFNDLPRAKQIAQTEGIRVYNNGAFKRWTDVGVKKARWRTVNDGLVCRVCRPMNGQVAEIAAGWVHPGGGEGDKYRGKVYGDSAHTGCRCFRTPDTSHLVEEQEAKKQGEKRPVSVKAPPPAAEPVTFLPLNDDQLRKLRTEWEAKFKDASKEDVNAARDYTRRGFRNTNAYLRETEMYDPDTGEDVVVDDAIRADQNAKIEKISSLMQPLDRNVEVYRGVQSIEHIGISLDDPESAIGTVLTDKGFTSTSFDRNIVDKGFGQFNNAGRITIKVPQGTSSLYAEPLSSFGGASQERGERELLLGRGTSYRITKITPVKQKWMTVYDIEAEVIGQDPTPIAKAPPPPAKPTFHIQEQHKQAVKNYSESGFKLNKLLREGGEIEGDLLDTSVYNPKGVDIKKVYTDLDEAVSNSTIPQDTKVYRGMTQLPPGFEDLKPGDAWMDKAFVSTTVDQRTAEQFYTTKQGGLVEVTLPSGSKGLNVTQALSGNDPNQEILLPRGSRFVIDSIEMRTIQIQYPKGSRTIPVYHVHVEAS